MPPKPSGHIRTRPDGVRFAKGEQLCDLCANLDGCPFREGIKTLIRLCDEFDASANILGPIPTLRECEGDA